MTRRKVVDAAQRESVQELERRREQQSLAADARMRERLAFQARRIKELEQTIAGMRELEHIITQLEANPLKRRKFDARETGGHEAIAVQILSDLHLEETVDPAEVNGLNQYNLEIAADSMRRLAIGTAWYLDLSRKRGKGPGFKIRDLVVACCGDIVTNYLRDEDIAANGLTPFEAVLFAEEQIVMYVRSVVAACPWLERVYIPMVAGNHDRLTFTRKTPFRQRQKLSLATILAHGLRRELADDPRVVVELAPAEHHYFDAYGHAIRLMHGDRFRYAGGVGGIYVPARRHIAGLNRATHAALTLFGHWHMSKEDDDWISNGSLIGPNAYSIALGLDPEPPSQTFFLLDRDRGKRMVTPIQCRSERSW